MPEALDVPHWQAQPASDQVFSLGEGPIWDEARQQALWVDIDTGTVHAGGLEGDRVVPLASHQVDRTVGAVGLADDGGLVVAGTRRLVVVSPEGTVTPWMPVLPDDMDSRLNDGAVDPTGAYLVGSLPLDDRTGEELLVRVTPTGVQVLDDDLSLSNGLGWSPDGTTLYSIDSVPGVVWARDFDPGTAAVGPRRDAVRIVDATPDGICVDRDGRLWVALWGAGQVRCFTPDGTLVGVVDVPAPHTTSCAFVGPGLDRLLITSSTNDLTVQQRRTYPDSGRLFLADVDAVGRLPYRWRTT